MGITYTNNEHMKRNYLLTFILALVIASCGGSDDDEAETLLTVSPNTFTLSSDGDSQVLKIQSNTSWLITGASGWLSLSSSSGKGNASVVLTAQESKDIDERKCTLIVQSEGGEISEPVSVVQQGVSVSLSVDVKEINLAEAGKEQTFNITCNTSWSISGVPEWLTVSSTNGVGNAAIKVSANSFNNSPADRDVTLNISSSGGSSQSVKIIQKAGLAAGSNVTAQTVVVLSDCFATDFEYGSNVTYFYAVVFEASFIERYTDEEIIDVMKTDENRCTPNDNYVISFYGLEPQTKHVLFLLGFNKDGERGELIRKEITTKSGTNQPEAYVSNVTYTTSEWSWYTTIGAYATKYYQWILEYSSNYYNSSDGLVAWYFSKNIKERPNADFDPILQSGGWTRARTSSITKLQTVTWGVGQSGELGGTINNYHWEPKANGVMRINESNRNTAKGIAHIGMIVNENTLFKGATITRIR